MKRFRRCIAMMLAISFLMVVPALATVKASEQIFKYSLKATPSSGGEIKIAFSITGTKTMSRIGSDSIEIYEETSRGWTLVESYNADDAGMSKKNTFVHNNAIYYQGEAGTKYKVYVSVFAEDSSGGYDSRDDTFYVTAQ